MNVKVLLPLLMMSLVASFILSSTAIPTSRSLPSINKEDPSSTNVVAQGGTAVKDDGKLLEVDEGPQKARMDTVTTDYRDRIVNHRHDLTAPSMETKNGEELLDLKGGNMMQRMDAEIMDYGPPGANHRHDPGHPPHA